MSYPIADIVKLLKAKWLQKGKPVNISHLLVDSRKLIYPDSTLFVPLITPRRDGHQFIPELYKKGVRAFLASHPFDTHAVPGAAVILVDDTLSAFQTLAAIHRKKFNIPVIGITGSNGKTIIKEWLFQLLEKDYCIVRSPKSYNSQTGVPLSVWQMAPEHTLGIFEAGISQPGEMAHLEKIIYPTIGIFTNIGDAHNEGFLNILQKVREKLLLFTQAEVLIYCKDHLDVNECVLQFHGLMRHKERSNEKPLRLLTWSRKTEADLQIKEILKPAWEENPSQIVVIARSEERATKQSHHPSGDCFIPPNAQIPKNGIRNDGTTIWDAPGEKNAPFKKENKFTRINAIYRGKPIYILIPFNDRGSIENAIHCWCLMLWLQVNNDVIQKRMEQLSPVAMRLELKEALNDCSLINDSYNSDLVSLFIALDFLVQQKQHPGHTLILSDILQSGRSDAELYEDIAGLLSQKEVNRLIGIGRNISREKDIFLKMNNLESSFYPDTKNFISHFISSSTERNPLTFRDETILLKGARVFEFERIGQLLEQKTHQTILEINLNAIAHNLRTYQGLLDPGVKTMAMVKAFSYGSGSYEIASLLQFHRVDYLAVAYADEGVALRKRGISLPIMVMNPEPGTFHAIIRWNLEPEIYSLHLLKQFEEMLGSLHVAHYPIHIKLDTGMHRLGFSKEDMPSLIARLKQNSSLKVISVFSHLAAADDPASDSFTREQAALFEKGSKEIGRALPYSVLRHLANSSAICRYPEFQYDMVRLGIGLYGIDQTQLIQDKLETVSTLKTTISQLRSVQPGETVGYSRSGKADKEKIIATIPIGYADGYLRTLGNGRGNLYIHGKAAPVIGNICMDMLMLDVTEIPEVREGDTVTVFGENPTLPMVAEWAGTIPYEIMAGISQRVKRIYIQE